MCSPRRRWGARCRATRRAYWWWWWCARRHIVAVARGWTVDDSQQVDGHDQRRLGGRTVCTRSHADREYGVRCACTLPAGLASYGGACAPSDAQQRLTDRVVRVSFRADADISAGRRGRADGTLGLWPCIGSGARWGWQQRRGEQCRSPPASRPLVCSARLPVRLRAAALGTAAAGDAVRSAARGTAAAAR